MCFYFRTIQSVCTCDNSGEIRAWHSNHHIAKSSRFDWAKERGTRYGFQTRSLGTKREQPFTRSLSIIVCCDWMRPVSCGTSPSESHANRTFIEYLYRCMTCTINYQQLSAATFDVGSVRFFLNRFRTDFRVSTFSNRLRCGKVNVVYEHIAYPCSSTLIYYETRKYKPCSGQVARTLLEDPLSAT